MKANALLKLHKRQQDICEMIIDCDTRIRHKEIDLEAYKNKPNAWMYLPDVKWIEDRLKRNKSIRERLIRYYLDVQDRITSLQPHLPPIELTTTTEMDLSTELS